MLYAMILSIWLIVLVLTYTRIWFAFSLLDIKQYISYKSEIQAALLMKVNVSGVYQNKRRVVRSRVRWYGQPRRRIRLHGERENRYVSGPGENTKKKTTKNIGKCSSLSVPSNLLEHQRHEYKL